MTSDVDSLSKTLKIVLAITYRIMAVLKVETDIIANTAAILIGRAVILVIMSVESFKTAVIFFYLY